jgi:hypothetical protein
MTEKEASESGKTEENRSDDREKGGRSTETQKRKEVKKLAWGRRGLRGGEHRREPLGRQKES